MIVVTRPTGAHRAFAGADAVFWLVPPDPKAPSVEPAYVELGRPAHDALIHHGVGAQWPA
jgi:hypothetical protein